MLQRRATLFVLATLAACGSKDTGFQGDNTPPSGLEVRLEPLVPTQQVDDLRCTVEVPALDAQGDPVFYRFAWEVDGEPFDETSSSGHYIDDVVEAIHTVAGQEWTCTGIPSDNEMDGAPDSATVTVRSGFNGWVDTEVDVTAADYHFEGAGEVTASAGDVDGDGLPDLLFGSGVDADGTEVWLRRAAGYATDPGTYPAAGDVVLTTALAGVGLAPGSLAGPGDLDGDGFGEVALASLDTLLVVSGATIPADSGPLQVDDDASVGTASGVLGPMAGGLVDGDATSDLVITQTIAGHATAHLLGSGDLPAAFDVDALEIVAELDGTVSAVAAGDIDGDGHDDVALAAQDAGRVVIALSTGHTCELVGDAGERFGAAVDLGGDIDGDLLGDVVVGAPAAAGEDGAGDGVIYVFHGVSMLGCDGVHDLAADQVLVGFGGGAAGSSLAMTDVDADRLADVLVGQPALSQASLLLGADMIGAEVQLDSRPDYLFVDGAAGEVLVFAPGDVEADGRADVGVIVPDSRATVIFRSP